LLENFVKLYLGGKSVHEIRELEDSNYKIFTKKLGLPVKILATSKCLEGIYPLKSFYEFFQNNPYFWMVPLATPNKKIIGFVLRGYNAHDYRTVFDFESLPPVFGFEEFSDFKQGNPIVLCEGVKDSIWIKQFYPYVLSLNTSNITTSNLQVLSKLTDKIILSYDNDETGKSSTRSDMKLLKDNGFVCDYVVPTHKDCAEYIDNSYGVDNYVLALEGKLKLFGGKN